MDNTLKKWQNEWNSEGVRILVLASLSIQIGLTFLAPLRKRSSNKVLALTIWLLYLTADLVPTLALGNMGNQIDPADCGDSGTIPGDLTILWTPFLLLHLGGPDTITSYSIDDNELWWRLPLGLVIQVVAAVYAFWQSPPNLVLWIPTTLVGIAGMIKFVERTLALRSGSRDNMTNEIISEINPGKHTMIGSMENTTSNAVQENETTRVSNENTTSNAVNQANGTPKGRWSNLMGKIKAVLFPPEEDTLDYLVPSCVNSKDESQAIYEGFRWFNINKRLLVDVTFETDLLMKSQDRFSDLSSTDALRLVAIELSFLYDVLHTKAVHMHCISGRVLRYFSLFSIIAALVVFHHLDKQKYVSGDIIITYILFGAGLSLEVIATMLLVFSDWTVVALTRTGHSQCVVSCIIELVKEFFLKKGRPRWACTIGQFNLIGVCLRDRDTVLAKIMRFLKIKHLWDNMRESRSIPLLRGKLEDIMFTEAKRRAQNVHIYNVSVKARCHRGNKALERHGQLENLEWSMKREFDECIILWHLATDICYYNDTSNQTNRNGSERETSNQPKRNNDTERETSNQPKGNNETEGETSNQPKGENQEPSNQPNGENQEPSNQPNGRKNCWSLPKRKVQPNEKIDTKRDVSWKISNYMVYLLTQQHSMMRLDYGKKQFETTCAVVKRKLKGKGKLEDKKARIVLEEERNEPNNGVVIPVFDNVSKPGWICWGRRKREDEDEMGKLVLRHSLRLVEELQKVDQQRRWELISEIWMEMLGYAAINCNSYQHAKSLSRGGELLTHLWLLISQLGLVEEHKMRQFDDASV